MIEEIKLLSPMGRSAQDVAKAMIGLPWKADDTIIGEVIKAWVDGYSVRCRVKFYRVLANQVKQLNMPQSEQELPETRDYDIKYASWDRIFNVMLRIKAKEMRNVQSQN
jgi:hypothetical protein